MYCPKCGTILGSSEHCTICGCVPAAAAALVHPALRPTVSAAKIIQCPYCRRVVNPSDFKEDKREWMDEANGWWYKCPNLYCEFYILNMEASLNMELKAIISSPLKYFNKEILSNIYCPQCSSSVFTVKSDDTFFHVCSTNTQHVFYFVREPKPHGTPASEMLSSSLPAAAGSSSSNLPPVLAQCVQCRKFNVCVSSNTVNLKTVVCQDCACKVAASSFVCMLCAVEVVSTPGMLCNYCQQQRSQTFICAFCGVGSVSTPGTPCNDCWQQHLLASGAFFHASPPQIFCNICHKLFAPTEGSVEPICSTCSQPPQVSVVAKRQLPLCANCNVRYSQRGKNVCTLCGKNGPSQPLRLRRLAPKPHIVAPSARQESCRRCKSGSQPFFNGLCAKCSKQPANR